MDISGSLAPRSDQQNFDDYTTAPKTVTVSEVRPGTAEQPVEIHLVEFPGRPYKPSKSMRRVIAAAWGPEASVYAGRKLTLYGDPTVKFGSAVVGGIKISHLSHLDGPMTVNLTTTRGKRAPFKVEPLTAESTPDPTDKAVAAIRACTDPTKLDAIEAHAKSLGIDGVTAVRSALDTKRAELDEGVA